MVRYWTVSSLPNTTIPPTPPGFEPWILALKVAALYRLRQSDWTEAGQQQRAVMVTATMSNLSILLSKIYLFI